MLAILLASVLLVVDAQSTPLSYADAVKMLSGNETVVLVDVRSVDAYQLSHLKGAVLASKTNLDRCKETKVFFYCSGATASRSAADKFAQSGGSSSYAIGTISGLRQAGAVRI